MDPSEIQAAFTAVIPIYENRVDAWLPGISQSNERVALVSLAYGSPTGSTDLLGNKLRQAILDDNRAEAWYEIRYRSNGNGQHTDRRITESSLFSLYDNPGQGVGEAEAKEVLRMYTTHRTVIQAYESQFSTQFAPSGTATIQFQLLGAETTLIALYAEGRTIDGEVWVGADDLIPGDTLPGTTLNDLIFGEKGHDILKGEAGDDVLLGGDGTDQLTGGTGNDYLDGGQGYDTYIYRINDGQDTISDSDGKASIFYDGKLVVGGQRLAGSTGVYTSLDGTFTFLQSGADLIINNLLTIKNYTSGQNGITLRELSTISTNAPVTTRTIVGDFQPLDTDVVEEGIQIGFDDLGTVIQDPQSPGDRSDLLNGSGNNDQMNGGALRDRLTALGGSDMLTGGSDGDVLIG
jgi:Ca2+-binding RTX toxin-like protein